MSILRFRHLLEQPDLAPKMLEAVNAALAAKGLMLKEGTAVDASLIAAPSSTKNGTGTRAPEMHQTKKGNQWHFGMKCHIGVDADSRLVHTVVGTAANVNDVTQTHALVHGEEADVFADAVYQGVDKREDTQDHRPPPDAPDCDQPGPSRYLPSFKTAPQRVWGLALIGRAETGICSEHAAALHQHNHQWQEAPQCGKSCHHTDFAKIGTKPLFRRG